MTFFVPVICSYLNFDKAFEERKGCKTYSPKWQKLKAFLFHLFHLEISISLNSRYSCKKSLGRCAFNAVNVKTVNV